MLWFYSGLKTIFGADYEQYFSPAFQFPVDDEFDMFLPSFQLKIGSENGAFKFKHAPPDFNNLCVF